MKVEDVRKISTGEFYLGQEAKNLGLIDELGNEDTAIEMMKKELNVKDIKVEKKEHKSGVLDLLTGVSYNMGRGFGSLLQQQDSLKIKAQ